jgi:thioredoxin-like negative regulator of GroEL
MAGITNRQELDEVLVAGRESLAANAFEEAGRLLRLADESTFLTAAEKPQLWLEIGRAAEGGGSPDSAASFYEAAANGGNPTVAAEAADRLAALRQVDTAREQAAGLGEQTTPEYFDVGAQATMAYMRGDYMTALELYTAQYNAPGEMSTKGAVITGIVFCLVALGRYDEARQYFDYGRSQGASVEGADKELLVYEAARAAAADGVSGREFATVKQAAIQAFERRDYSGAADLFRQLLDEPYVPGWGNAEISYNLGQCLLQMQDYDGARYYLEQAKGKSTADVNQRTQALLQRLQHLHDALAVDEPHLVP